MLIGMRQKARQFGTLVCDVTTSAKSFDRFWFRIKICCSQCRSGWDRRHASLVHWFVMWLLLPNPLISDSGSQSVVVNADWDETEGTPVWYTGLWCDYFCQILWSFLTPDDDTNGLVHKLLLVSFVLGRDRRHTSLVHWFVMWLLSNLELYWLQLVLPIV